MQIRIEKIIGTVKCVATCGTIEIQPVETLNSSALQIIFLTGTYSAGAVAYALCSVILSCNSNKTA